MKKFEKKYFCTNCRKKVSAVNELYFIEENSQRGFCGEACIEKYYLPLVENFEEADDKLKKEDEHHSGDFDYLQNNNEVVEKIFSEPDEVYFLRNEVGETLYFFHKKFAEGYMGISICHMYNQEPSFIYMCSVTDSQVVSDHYRTGDKAQIKRNSDIPDLSKEEIDYIEQKKSLFLATVLERRSEKDISFEDFPFYQTYLPKTMNDPDEVYELVDNEGDKFYSYIKTFEKEGKSFYFISLCIKGLGSSTESSEVYPVVAIPTKSVDFYKNFKSDSVISRSIKN